MEFKKPGTTKRELAIQNRKNVRLARCIQGAHAVLGVTDSSALIVNVAAFVGTIYQVRPLNEIAVAREAAGATVSLPQTRTTQVAFLEDPLSCYDVERHFSFGVPGTIGIRSKGASRATDQIRFQDSVILTLTKKRVKILTIVEIEDPDELSTP
ncbi:hypothetical protein BGZ99_006034 [Dissophora globulifera]|uniref:Uncharacterized protein n=1 Tax=Dissophora globulifera TaxID=979702 RepID=A0A9P6UZK7_9FUNG|nr:hypothetical protein BGZ99_006034 [Dissophora globulifera]